MLLNNISPGEHLKSIVRFYRIIDFDFTDEPDSSDHVKAYRPRIEHCLQFTPFDTETVIYPDRSRSEQKIAFFGQHTQLTQRNVGKRFLNFQIVFQPGVLSSCLKISMEELTNIYTDATVFWTPQELSDTNKRLSTAHNYADMIGIIEIFLVQWIRKKEYSLHPIHRIALELLRPYPLKDIEWYALQANLSYRQFDRAFKCCTGISPKDFRSLVRLDLAYLIKNRHPQKDWMTIALESGFYDYQHLSKSYKKFTGLSPTGFYLLEQRAPERHFGDYEQ